MEASSTNSRRVPLDKRKRTETSCDKCKTRKQKCDKPPGKIECRYCEINKIACVTTQQRKRRTYGGVEPLGGRMALLESLVKGLVPEADLSSNDEMKSLGKSLGIPLPEVEDVDIDSETIRKEEDDYTIPLLPDQQGQVQYIGPASSFSFHLNLRRLIGNYPAYEFAMFGRNAADQLDAPAISNNISKPNDGRVGRPRTALSNVPSDCNSPSDAVREIDGPILDALIDAYFDTIHSDFPVLHEASFREAYEIWSASTSSADPVWLCGLLCVLILSPRVASITIPKEVEKKWWQLIQTLLPTVFFTSNIYTVQALMLAALHLHNTSHRDACWNLTGTAVRIAFAIGLHRDDIKYVHSPLARELRKQLWWTLYAFEQMQVSSYDRPSAIAHTSSVSCPNERIVGVAGHCPQDLMKWSQKLVVLLGSACKALNPSGTSTVASADGAYSGPLSPAAGILRDLDRWKESVPSHLRLELTDSLAPSSRRPVILLHAQFYYTVVLMSRAALLRRATNLSSNNPEDFSQTLLTVSDTCINSGRSLGRLLRKLETINKFNALTWWDIFYTVASALILVLDIICRVKQHGPESAAESQNLLRELAALASRQMANPKVPGSMRTWALIVVEVNAMADQYTSLPLSQNNDSLQPIQRRSLPDGGYYESASEEIYTSPSSTHREFNSDEVASSHGLNQIRENIPQFWSQLSFMDESNGRLEDWRWDDIEKAILRGNASP